MKWHGSIWRGQSELIRLASNLTAYIVIAAHVVAAVIAVYLEGVKL